MFLIGMKLSVSLCSHFSMYLMTPLSRKSTAKEMRASKMPVMM